MRFDTMGIAPRLPPSPSQVEEAQATHELKSRAMEYGPTQQGKAAAAAESDSNVTATQPLSSATRESCEKDNDDQREALQRRTSQLQSYATSDHYNGIHSRRPHRRRRSSRHRSSSPSSALAAAEASTSKQRQHSHSVDGGVSPPEQRSPTEKAAAARTNNDYDIDDIDDVHSSNRSYISTSEYDEDAVGAIDPPARKRYRDRPDDYDVDDDYYNEQHKRRNAKHAAMMSEPSEQTHDVGVEGDEARHRLGDSMPTSMAGGSSEQAKSVVKTEEGSNSALSSRQSTLPSLSSLPPPQHSHSAFPPRASPAVGAAQQQQRRWRSPSPSASLPAMTTAQQQPAAHSAVRHRRVTPTPLVEEEHEHLEGILRAANTMSRFVSRIGRDGFVPELSAGSEWDEVNENLRVAVRRVDILNKRWLSTTTTSGGGGAGQAALMSSMSRSTSVPYQLANEGDGRGGPFAFRHAPPPSHRISTSALTHLPPPPGVRSPPDRFVASQYDFAARTPSTTTTARHSTGAVRSTLSNLPPPPPLPGGAASSSSAYHRSPPPGGGSEWYNVRQSDGISRPLHLRSSSWQNQGQPQYVVGRAPADRRMEWNGAEAQQHRSLYTGDAHHHDDRVAPTGMPGIPSSEYGGRASRFLTTTTATAYAAAPNAPPHLPMPHAGSSTRGGFATGYRAAPSDSMYYETDDGTNGGGVDDIASGSNHQSASASGSGGGGGSLRPSKYRKRSRAPAPGRCLSCAASDTPEWRRGPTGARTLCNACGLQYSKLIRRKRQDERDPEAEVSMDELRQSLKLYTPA